MARGESKASKEGSRGNVWSAIKLVFFFCLVVALGVGAGVGWVLFDKLGGVATVKQVTESLAHPGEKAFGEREKMHILCLGIDYNHDSKGILYTKYARSDTVFVVTVDRSADSLSVVSIPRDMRVEIPGHGFDKINTAYSYKADGDVDLARQTVERFLGIKIDHTLVIKPYAVEHLVDALGGVDIDVEKNMDYDDNWGNLHIHLKKGVQHLTGRQAVGYIRFRKDEEGDRGRIRRQQQFVKAMMSQLPRIQTLSNIGKVQQALKTDIVTSIAYDHLIDLGILYKGFDRKKMKSARIEGNDALIDDCYYMVADEAQKRKVVAELLRSGEDVAIRPADIRIEVLNGSGVTGAAGHFADLLRAQGYQVVRVGNADPTKTTKLIERLHDAKATDAVQKIAVTGGAQPEVTTEEGDAAKTDMTLVVGENYRTQ